MHRRAVRAAVALCEGFKGTNDWKLGRDASRRAGCSLLSFEKLGKK